MQVSVIHHFEKFSAARNRYIAMINKIENELNPQLTISLQDTFNYTATIGVFSNIVIASAQK
jgi:hypothetical protein